MKRLFALVQKLALSDIPVLVMGETGAGKEIVAAALHAWSARGDQRLVSINCAALSEALFESELFGYERGAFSGAYATKIGLLESAQGGTVFLDEIGELSLAMQAKLLRVLETRTLTRVGAVAERPIDVRIVGASNRNLEQDVAAGRFRQDLYFRLNAATVVVPPLRDRRLDVHPLARAFLEDSCARLARSPMSLSDDVLLRLAQHPWPGNVRELRNLMEYVAATVQGDVVEERHLPARLGESAGAQAPPANGQGGGASALSPPPVFRNLYDEIRELERTRLEQALAAAGGVRVKAAALIGMPLRTLVTKLKEHGLGGTRRSK